MFLNSQKIWCEGAIGPKYLPSVAQAETWTTLLAPMVGFTASGMVLLNPCLNCQVPLFLAIQDNPRTPKDIWHAARTLDFR